MNIHINIHINYGEIPHGEPPWGNPPWGNPPTGESHHGIIPPWGHPVSSSAVLLQFLTDHSSLGSQTGKEVQRFNSRGLNKGPPQG